MMQCVSYCLGSYRNLISASPNRHLHSQAVCFSHMLTCLCSVRHSVVTVTTRWGKVLAACVGINTESELIEEIWYYALRCICTVQGLQDSIGERRDRLICASSILDVFSASKSGVDLYAYRLIRGNIRYMSVCCCKTLTM